MNENSEQKTSRNRIERQSEPVKVNNVTIGRIDVNYLTKKPDVDEGPFLKEERMLLNTVAERLGRVIQRIRAEEAVKESEVRYRELFENMALGYAYCRMLYKDDNPVDFIYLAVNKAFEKQTGLKNVVGKKISEVIPGIRESDPKVFELYGRVASTGSARDHGAVCGIAENVGLDFGLQPKAGVFCCHVRRNYRAETGGRIFTKERRKIPDYCGKYPRYYFHTQY